MDVSQQNYYKINEILMKFVGLWPYQSKFASRSILVFIIAASIGQIASQVMAVIKYRDHSEIMVQAVTIFMIDFVCFTKFFSCIFNSKMRLKLLNRIGENWKKWEHEHEVAVLHEYSESGRKISLIYAVTLYAPTTFVMTTSLLPKIIDTLLKNGTQPGKFPFPVYYYQLDEQQYYFYIIGYIYLCVTLIMGFTIAGDTMVIVYVQHACGMFAALGQKLKRIGEAGESVDGKDLEFENLSKCIDRHQDAIEFANLIEAAYSGCFFFLVGFNMLQMSVTGLQLIKSTNELQEIVKCVILVGGEFGHLFMQSYISQVLMDHSTSIRDNIHNNKWYNSSLRCQKLLNLMAMRCNTPCCLTAGKIWIMSIETFGARETNSVSKVVKTSMSYFTVLRSLQ